MNLEEAILSRRSIRKYKNTKIDHDLLARIIEISTHAPSACNRQLWEILIIDDEKTKQELYPALEQPQVRYAPAVIFILYDVSKELPKSNSADIQSAVCVASNIMLLSNSFGLGTCMIGGISNMEHLRRVLKIPDSYKIISIITIGYPDETPAVPTYRQNVLQFNELHIDKPLYPNSLEPDEWTLEELKVFQETICWFGHEPEGYLKDVFDESIKYLDRFKHGTALFMLPYTGRVPKILERNFDKIYCCTLSNELGRFAKEKRGLNATLFLFDETITEKFDFVFLVHCLECMKDWKSVLGEARKYLKPSGRVVVTFYNKKSIYGLFNIICRKIKSLNDIRLYGNTWAYGPLRCLSYDEVADSLNAMGLKIDEKWDAVPLPKQMRSTVIGKIVHPFLKKSGLEKIKGFGTVVTISTRLK